MQVLTGRNHLKVIYLLDGVRVPAYGSSVINILQYPYLTLPYLLKVQYPVIPQWTEDPLNANKHTIYTPYIAYNTFQLAHHLLINRSSAPQIHCSIAKSVTTPFVRSHSKHPAIPAWQSDRVSGLGYNQRGQGIFLCSAPTIPSICQRRSLSAGINIRRSIVASVRANHRPDQPYMPALAEVKAQTAYA